MWGDPRLRTSFELGLGLAQVGVQGISMCLPMCLLLMMHQHISHGQWARWDISAPASQGDQMSPAATAALAKLPQTQDSPKAFPSRSPPCLHSFASDIGLAHPYRHPSLSVES